MCANQFPILRHLKATHIHIATQRRLSIQSEHLPRHNFPDDFSEASQSATALSQHECAALLRLPCPPFERQIPSQNNNLRYISGYMASAMTRSDFIAAGEKITKSLQKPL